MTESLIPVSRTAIKYLFGPGVRPLAFVRIKTEVKRDIQLDLAVDTFLLTNGAPVGIADTLERYNRPTPGPDEDLLKPPVAAAATDAKEEDTEATIEKAANDLRAAQDKADAAAAKLQSLALRQFATANAKDFQPVVTRINQIADLEDKQLQDAALVKFKRDLPGMLVAMNIAPAKVKVLADAMAAALFNGVAIGAVQTHQTEDSTAAENAKSGGKFAKGSGRWVTVDGHHIFIKNKAGFDHSDAEVPRMHPSKLAVGDSVVAVHRSLTQPKISTGKLVKLGQRDAHIEHDQHKEWDDMMLQRAKKEQNYPPERRTSADVTARSTAKFKAENPQFVTRKHPIAEVEHAVKNGRHYSVDESVPTNA